MERDDEMRAIELTLKTLQKLANFGARRRVIAYVTERIASEEMESQQAARTQQGLTAD